MLDGERSLQSLLRTAVCEPWKARPPYGGSSETWEGAHVSAVVLLLYVKFNGPQAPQEFNLKEKEKNAPCVSFINIEFLTLVPWWLQVVL